MAGQGRDTVRIGCGGGFWGDSPEGAAQIVRRGEVDYLVMDYLAEITMSILARAREKSPEAGYAGDFVEGVMRPLAAEIKAKGIRVVVNAGGVNLAACRAALETECAAQGLVLRVAVVEGDDLSGQLDQLRAADTREMFSGAALPGRISSANAYLGALGIARALDLGADVVLTGRVVDSALVLGPLIHEFGWRAIDHDRLSAGSLAGHLLECGTQVTGGILTDWRRTAADWADMGFPIAVCHADGSFEITKPAGTGGEVSVAGVAEQLGYEVGDPAAYALPDVLCDWSEVRLCQLGPDRVGVSGARGHAPGPDLKASLTWPDGYRAAVTLMIVGREAAEKATATGAAILARVARLIAEAGFAPLTETLTEILGAETSYGAAARARPREVVLKLAVRHPDRRALAIFAREIYPAACAMAQGLTGFAGGRPSPQPVVRLFSCLVPKAQVPVWVDVAGQREAVAHGPVAPPPPVAPLRGLFGAPEPGADAAHPVEAGARVWVPLVALAHGRSGDKGDRANIVVLARDPAYLPILHAHLTAEAVAGWFAHYLQGPVTRHGWPGLQGFNFLMERALGGGGIASLRHDPQGKALAQVLMDLPLPVPAAWVAPGGRLQDYAMEARADDPFAD